MEEALDTSQDWPFVSIDCVEMASPARCSHSSAVVAVAAALYVLAKVGERRDEGGFAVMPAGPM